MLSLTCEREAHGALYVVYDPQGEVIGRIEKVPHPWDTNARGHIRAPVSYTHLTLPTNREV